MKILIVTHYFKPHIGGIEIVAYNQAKELAKKGHQVTIVTSKLDREKAIEQKENIRIVRVPAWNLFEKKFDVPYPIFSPRLVSIINREIKVSDIIHLHGYLYLGTFLSAILAIIYKKKFIITEHVGFVKYKSKIINMVEKLAIYTIGLSTIRASSAITVLNMSVYKWVKQYKKEVYYLPNGVDLQLFNKPTQQEKHIIREIYNIPLEKFMVLFVGRFVSKKGFDILYNAKDPSYLLVFVSGGSIPGYVQSDDSVRIMGPLPQEELALLYKASDVFILPSYGEGFPLSIQEAMATGLPIITSKQNNLDQILDDPLIMSIDVTETAIKSTIKKIQKNRMLQEDMSEYSSKIARENYSWEKNTTKLVDIYHSKSQLNTMRELKKREGPLKVLFITPYFPPSLGGVENYVFNIALGLKQTYNHEVVVVTSNANGKKQSVEDYYGIKVYRLPTMLRIANTPINPLWYLTLRKIVRLEKPDIINSHQPVPFIGDLTAFLAGNIPFVLTYHFGTMRKNRFLLDSIIFLYEMLILPHTARKAAKIICASNFVRNTILKKYAFKSTVIQPGVNISLFKPNSAIERDKNCILFICSHKSMHAMKGLYYLLDAIKTISEVKINVIGEKSNFADKRLVSLGIKREKDLVEEMQKASLVVLPSTVNMEGFPMVLIEAMACQTPVIGTNIGGIPEVIREGIDGFIVPTDDSSALALAISKILANKELAIRMGQLGEAKVREKLTWDTRVALTKEVFESCLE